MMRNLILVVCKFFSMLLIASLGLVQNAYPHLDLTVVDWGGDLARAHMKAWIIPWENDYGKTAQLLYYSGGLAEISEQVSTTNVIWDVVDMEYSDLIQACNAGLLETIDHDELLWASDDFIEGSLANECGVGIYVWSTVYAYNTVVFADLPPSTIADFFDIKKFPGRRGLRKDPRGTLEWALISAGIPTDRLYETLSTPEGMDLAFAELDFIKPYIVWWSDGSSPPRMINDGTVTMSAAWNGRLYRPMVEDNAPIGIVWDGQVWEIEFLAIPKGSRNLDDAKQFIKFASSTRGLADIANNIPYGPTRKSSQAKVSETIRKMLPTENLNSTSLRFDSVWWAENINTVRERFEQWIAPSSADIQGRGARF